MKDIGYVSTQQLYTLILPIVVVAEIEAEQKVKKEIDKKIKVRRTNANNAKWTTIPENHVDREVTLQITHTIVIQTTSEMISELGNMQISQDMSSVTTSTLNICRINLTNVIWVLYHLPLQENAI
jgi:hypothetical protein